MYDRALSRSQCPRHLGVAFGGNHEGEGDGHGHHAALRPRDKDERYVAIQHSAEDRDLPPRLVAEAKREPQALGPGLEALVVQNKPRHGVLDPPRGRLRGLAHRGSALSQPHPRTCHSARATAVATNRAWGIVSNSPA